MKNITINKILISLLLITLTATSFAKDDTDIYFPGEAVSTSQNVLFIMDVSGSMRREIGNTGINRFDAMKSAFNAILTTVPPTINVGLMNFGSTSSARNNYAQGVKFPVSPLLANARTIMEDGLPLNQDGTVNWAANNMPEPTVGMTVFDFLPEITNSWSPRGWTPLVDSIYEAALYFRGEKVAWGSGPLEENGNEWVAHPSTYSGAPGGWNPAACQSTWTERLAEGVIPVEYRCPSSPYDSSVDGTYANCAATAADCIEVTGGTTASNSAVTNLDTTHTQAGSWPNSTDARAIDASTNQEFTFTVTETDSITIEAYSNNFNDWPYIYLLDDQGTKIAEEQYDGYYYSGISEVLDPGTYTIRVGTWFTGQTGNFSLYVSGYVDSLKNVDGYSKYQIGGSWASSGGRDETSDANPKYYFTVTQQGDVTIDLNALYNSNPNADAYLYLLDDQGNQLTLDDDSGNSNTLETRYDSRITLPLDVGTYQIVAATYNTGTSADFEIYLKGYIGELPYSGSLLTYPSARYIKFEALSEINNQAWTSAAEISITDNNDNPLTPTSITTDSEELIDEDGAVSNAIDGDNTTIWHTEWGSSNPQHPHHAIIDLGASHSLKGFRYLPRQSGTSNGTIDQYNIYLSDDGINWGTATLSGNFDYTNGNATEQTLVFPTATSGTGGGVISTAIICHIPTDNPDNAQTMVVSLADLDTHRAHGDLTGACGGGLSSEGVTQGTCLYTMCTGGANAEPTYISPVQSACQSNAIILLSDGHPEASSNAVTVNATYDKVVTNNEWTGALPDAFRNLNCESSPNGFVRGKCGKELTHYLATTDNLSNFDGDQTIQTYTIGLGLGQGTSAEEYLKSLSSVDNLSTTNVVEGYYSATDQATLVTAFSEILAELELNTSTTAFSNPGYSIVAKTGLNHEDSIFIPTFEVGRNSLWKGNLKKFKFANTNGSRLIQGKNDQNAVTELGAFTVGAFDLWSKSLTPDGTQVDKGGAASHLDNPGSRNLYTDRACTAGSVCNLTILSNRISIENDTGNQGNENGLTNADLGIVDDNSNTWKKYICFIRGYDNYDTDSENCSGNAREHMGDMLHFEPLVATYHFEHDDRDDSTHRQIIFAGTNEGYLHAFDADSGDEVFAFMPKELLKNIPTQYDDDQYRSHRYGVDGYATLWVEDSNKNGIIVGDNGTVETGDHVYLYFGLRRGGNAYYALDISNPSAPKLKWKIQGGSGDFEHLGQTWSRPYLARIHTSKTDATLRDVLIFSGGYDAENQDKPLADRDATDSTGNDIFIVDANTGEFIWSLKENISDASALTHSVPGGVRILDMDKDGAIDRMYFADVVGNVWRVELDIDKYDADTTSYYDLDKAKLIKLATLGETAEGEEPRKFFNEPDVSLSRKGNVSSLLVSIGSGDRTDPVTSSTTDRFYVLVDKNINTNKPDSYLTLEHADLAAVVMGRDSEGARTLTNPITNNSILATEGQEGWYLQFSDTGEKVLSNSITNHGKVIFTTLVPDIHANMVSDITACNIPATQGRAYVLDILKGKAAVDLNATGGDPDNDDLYAIVSASEIPGAVQLIFNEPLAEDGSSCSASNCTQNVDFRSGKKLSQVWSYNAGMLESIFQSKPQEKD